MRFKYYILAALILVISLLSCNGQKTIIIDLDNSYAEIQPTMWGIFFEDINFAADGGIYAELVKNRSFEFYEPKMAWRRVNANGGEGDFLIINRSNFPNNPRFARIISKNAEGKFGIANEGFRGLPVRENMQYRFSLLARTEADNPVKLLVQLLDSAGNVVGETNLEGFTDQWEKHEAFLSSSVTDAHGKLNVLIDGKGVLDMDMVSLFPTDTWKNRKNGLRVDILQMLADLQPGFIRFPGGCIVEGHELETRYQWKMSVGDVENRKLIINRWNKELRHRQTPDYFQSFGLGFYEYFLLSEDLQAEPLPIINCGMACQYNTGELVQLDELDPYIQDALDLIEFANGPVESEWGRVRVEMGHPEPFNLKYIGIGNEQWGYQYVERYNIFAKAIREKFPEINLVSGSGPRPNDERFEYLWTQIPNMDVDVVDEHFYMSPEWFFENAERYDSFNRKDPVIFPGEYAAHGPEGEYASSRNTWLSALSEAAFMTGFERNADIVHMCAYAPLLAHVDAWQWRPDLIWFDNLSVFGSPNYYVQKLYSNHAGTHVVPTLLNGKTIIGQEKLYASTTIDKNKSQAYIKLINASKDTTSVTIQLKGKKKIDSSGKVFIMQSDDLLSYNSIKEPLKIAPVEKELSNVSKKFDYILPPQSFQVIVLELN
jgi:alpha-L-arabinofuranosidase